MRSRCLQKLLIGTGCFGVLGLMPTAARGQVLDGIRRRVVAQLDARETTDAVAESGGAPEPTYRFHSRADSLSWARARESAAHSSGFRLVVSLQDRHLWAIVDEDTVLSAPVAVAKGTTLDFEGSHWKFDTPRGVRHVLGKEADPIWIPPEWLYAETALEHDLKLRPIDEGHPIRISDGRILTVRGDLVGLVDDGQFEPLPVAEHIVFDNTLFVPPTSTQNRHVNGTLGKYRLNLGEGYLLHGTPDQNSIGMAATHGCVRLRDEDIEWLYENVPVGTSVYIY